MSALSNIKISRYEYEDKVPSTGKKVKLTPFRVGDEKVLLEAVASEEPGRMQNAIEQVIANCVTPVNIDELAPYDLEYLFLRLRSRSVGENVEIGIKCAKCETANKIPINLDSIEVVKNKDHKNTIKIQEGLMFEMGYPKDLKTEGKDAVELLLELIVHSVKKVYSGEDVIEITEAEHEDLRAIIDDLTSEQFASIQVFFNTAPKLSKEVTFECGDCGEHNDIKLEGLASFLQ